MKHVLLVEDSPECQLIVKRALEDSFKLTCVSLAAQAYVIAQENEVDLYILDVDLPDDTGFNLCSALRLTEKAQDSPIIFLTAKTDIKDKARGFSLGADDYLVKPFDPLELLMRVQAKLGRRETAERNSGTFRRGDILIDLPIQKAFLIEEHKKTDLDLTPMEFKLLYYFIKHPGQILPRTQLLKSVWGGNINVAQRTIDKHISSLKKKLLRRGNLIRAIYRKGYSFIDERKHN